MSILVGIGQLWGSAECLFWWELDNCGDLHNVYFCRNWTIADNIAQQHRCEFVPEAILKM